MGYQPRTEIGGLVQDVITKCKLCGLIGSKTVPHPCAGGHCELCGKTESKRVCSVCNRRICLKHADDLPDGSDVCVECVDDEVEIKRGKWDYSECMCIPCRERRGLF